MLKKLPVGIQAFSIGVHGSFIPAICQPLKPVSAFFIFDVKDLHSDLGEEPSYFFVKKLISYTKLNFLFTHQNNYSEISGLYENEAVDLSIKFLLTHNGMITTSTSCCILVSCKITNK